MASRPRSSCVLKGPRRRTSPGAGDLLNGRVVSQIINSNDSMTWSCAMHADRDGRTFQANPEDGCRACAAVVLLPGCRGGRAQPDPGRQPSRFSASPGPQGTMWQWLGSLAPHWHPALQPPRSLKTALAAVETQTCQPPSLIMHVKTNVRIGYRPMRDSRTYAPLYEGRYLRAASRTASRVTASRSKSWIDDPSTNI